METKTFLLYNLPNYYFQSKIAKSIFKSFDSELDRYSLSNSELKNQFFVTKATYALKYYEEDLGLPIEPKGITVEERRSRIKARMRMVGAVNKEMLQNVINAWTNAQVDIIEDYANYKVVIKFISVIGIPTNIQDVYTAISEIIPAHINVEYQFRYNKWIDVENKTWAELEQYTWQEVLEKE